MATDVEVAIVGGGVMGACTAWRAALRGRDVAVFERFARGHAHGSSHGTARIFRLAYPDADYVAMATGGLALWDELEAASGVTLRNRVGALDHGEPAEIAAIAANLATAGIAHEELTPADVAARWPGLRCDRAAVFHPAGGTVDAGATVLAALDVAEQAGAVVREECGVDRLEVLGDHAVLHTPDGPVSAKVVVVAVGAWVGRVLGPRPPDGPVLGHRASLPPMVVTREQPAHYDLLDDVVDGPGDPWPSFIHYSHDGPPKTSGIDEPVWGYGLPTPDGRLKLGEHHTGEVVAWIAHDRTGGPRGGTAIDEPPVDDVVPVDEVSLERMRAYARDWVPGVVPESGEPERCLYTTTPTTDFVLDRVGPVVVAAGFSGHGFKFAPRIGDLLADMADGAPAPAARFRLPT